MVLLAHLARGALLAWFLSACTSSPQKAELREVRPVSNTPSTHGKVTDSASTGSHSSRQNELRIAAWNVEWLNAEPLSGTLRRSLDDYARLKRYAEKLAPDVVALSEVDGPEAAARLFDSSSFEFHFSEAGGAQRTGFAFRSDIPVTLHPDLHSLATGGLRSGTDLTIGQGSQSIRLLAVHLKSACFKQPLNTSKACRKLAAQIPLVERWIDQRASEGIAFMVLGDFNRILFPAGKTDVVWKDWNDGEPPRLSLWSPTMRKTSHCWSGKHPEFIDHMVMNDELRSSMQTASFKEHLFAEQDAAHRRVLSDHCAISIDLNWPGLRSALPRRSPPALPTMHDDASAKPKHEQAVKGNITRDGRKLYHSFECPSYEETRIDKARGERLFLDIAAAEAAGFQRAGNCPKLDGR